MHKKFLATGAILGALAVALGAFGAHQLKEWVSLDTVQSFQTGVQYQVYHSLALMCAGMMYQRKPVGSIRWAAICFITGIILFSGSLYVLTAMKATGVVGMSGIGLITPVGGLFFIAGWLLLFSGIIKKES